MNKILCFVFGLFTIFLIWFCSQPSNQEQPSQSSQVETSSAGVTTQPVNNSENIKSFHVDSTEIATLLGVYYMQEDTFLLEVFWKEGKLWSNFFMAKGEELLPESQTHFRNMNQAITFDFLAATSKLPDRMQVAFQGKSVTANRIKALEKLSGKDFEKALKEVLAMKDFYSKVDGLGRMINKQGNEFLTRGEFTDAINAFRLSSSLDSRSAYSFYCLGEAYMQYGDGNRALASFKKALKLDPKNTAVKRKIKELEHLRR